MKPIAYCTPPCKLLRGHVDECDAEAIEDLAAYLARLRAQASTIEYAHSAFHDEARRYGTEEAWRAHDRLAALSAALALVAERAAEHRQQQKAIVGKAGDDPAWQALWAAEDARDEALEALDAQRQEVDRGA